MAKTPKLSIVIPCFNEAKNVTFVLKAFEKIVDSSPHNIEIIVIDGGSTDETPQELKQLFGKLAKKHFKLILNSKRGGYGNDIMHALKQATAMCWHGLMRICKPTRKMSSPPMNIISRQ